MCVSVKVKQKFDFASSERLAKYLARIQFVNETFDLYQMF